MALTFKRPSSGLRTIPVNELSAGQVVPGAWYHETATLLLKSGEELKEAHLRALKAAGIEEIYECKTEDDVIALVNATPKFPNPLAAVPVGRPIPFNIYGADNRFLLRKDGILAEAQFERLEKTASGGNIFVNDEKLLQVLRKYDLELTKCQAETIEQRFQNEKELRVRGGQSGLHACVRTEDGRSAEYIERAQKRYMQNVQAVAELLATLKKGIVVGVAAIGEIYNVMLEDLNHDLNLTIGLANGLDDGSFEYHSVNVAALSAGVGLALGYHKQEIKELGLAALLHETGMLDIPGEIVLKKSNLTTLERQRVSEHPVIALNYMGRVTGLPQASLIAVYQEHECLDRSGYPNKRPGNLIHDFAQIIGICDIFEGMTSPRPYRALEKLIYETSRAKYSPEILRGLLQLVGLFPIGSWVKLSNNCIGRVVGSNFQRYDQPLVSVLYDHNGAQLPPGKPLDLSKQDALKITDILDVAQFKVPCTFGF